jgi:hypothetical protein
MVATTVTGMGDGLLAEYVLDGCLAYLRGFRTGQPMSTQIVSPTITTDSTASTAVSTALNRVSAEPHELHAVLASLDDHQDRRGNAISATRAIAAYTAHRTLLTLAFPHAMPHGSQN